MSGTNKTEKNDKKFTNDVSVSRFILSLSFFFICVLVFFPVSQKDNYKSFYLTIWNVGRQKISLELVRRFNGFSRTERGKI